MDKHAYCLLLKGALLRWLTADGEDEQFIVNDLLYDLGVACHSSDLRICLEMLTRSRDVLPKRNLTLSRCEEWCDSHPLEGVGPGDWLVKVNRKDRERYLRLYPTSINHKVHLLCRWLAGIDVPGDVKLHFLRCNLVGAHTFPSYREWNDETDGVVDLSDQVAGAGTVIV